MYRYAGAIPVIAHDPNDMRIWGPMGFGFRPWGFGGFGFRPWGFGFGMPFFGGFGFPFI